MVQDIQELHALELIELTKDEKHVGIQDRPSDVSGR